MVHLCCFCLVLLCFHTSMFVDALWSPALIIKVVLSVLRGGLKKSPRTLI